MDSYEFYLLFHSDSGAFMTQLSEALSEDSEEIVTALGRLVKHKKIVSETLTNWCFDVLWNYIKKKNNFSKTIEPIFEQLLTIETLTVLRPWITECFADRAKSESKLFFQVLKMVTKLVDEESLQDFFKEIASKVLALLFWTASADAIAIVRDCMHNEKIRSWVLETLKQKFASCDPNNILNLSCFFGDMCQHNYIPENNLYLSKYFNKSDATVRKHGLFLLTSLITHKKVSVEDEESLKKFIVVAESLEETQNLISPTLKLVHELKFSENFTGFWFILSEMIMTHESSIVANWGLDFVLKQSSEEKLNIQQVVAVLNALNTTTLLDFTKKVEDESFKKFLVSNFNLAFKSLTEINWMPVSFYRVLEFITAHVVSSAEVDRSLAPNVREQIKVIPKRVKSLAIRSGVQELYSQIALKFKIKDPTTMMNLYNTDKKDATKKFCFADEICSLASREGALKSALVGLLKHWNREELLINCRNSKAPSKCIVHVGSQLKDIDPHFDRELEKVIFQEVRRMEQKIVSQNSVLSEEDIEILGMALRVYPECSHDSVVILDAISRKVVLEEMRFNKSWSLISVLIEYSSNFDPNLRRENLFQAQPSVAVVKCQQVTLKHLRKLNENVDEDSLKLLKNLEVLLDENIPAEELKPILDLIELITLQEIGCWMEKPESRNHLMSLNEIILQSIESTEQNFELLRKFSLMLLKTVDLYLSSSEWLDHVVSLFSGLLEKVGKNERAKFINFLIKSTKLSGIYGSTNSLKSFLKPLLMEQVTETELLTREQLLEMQVGFQIESSGINVHGSFSLKDRKNLRLRAAQVLAEYYSKEYESIVESWMEEFAKASAKKPRYFPNSRVHRMKMHFLQPLLFAKSLSKRTVEILLNDVIQINNQVDVTCLLEIILAKFHLGIHDLLIDEEQIGKLKSFTTKSVLSIIIMQLNMQYVSSKKKEFEDSILNDTADDCETDFERVHDMILPFAMGQHYGVRSMAQAAVIILNRNAQAVFESRDSSFLSRIEKSCEIINKSMKFKNAPKFFEALKEDFRFTFNFDEIWNIDVFYHLLPVATKTTFDEIASLEGFKADHFEEICFYTKLNESKFLVAELQKDVESYLSTDELLVPNSPEAISSSTNLQQKYLPSKFQVPGAKLMEMHPSIFKHDGDNILQLEKRSNLIVVASLITKLPNLGGLARTCEIFGAENYVIESLNLSESLEFKAISKTAEKWMKIAEIKHWQLFDYLLAMKHEGYTIVGAEQCDKSVCLTEAKIPVKCVLLLGNEKTGIPADILALLDLAIEIPQTGVVRSLNVHVSGAIVIWEYFKQHFANKSVTQ